MDLLPYRYAIDGRRTSARGVLAEGRVFTVAPSDLTFLLHECPRCFWNKVRGVRRRPQSPFPSVFTRLDRGQRAFFDRRPTSDVSPLLPPGRLDCRELKVCSTPLAFEGRQARLRIRGTIDVLIEFDDGTFGIIDLKTTSPGETSTAHYGLQLHAYALALEQADWLHRLASPITHLGLLCFDPTDLEQAVLRLAQTMDVTWIPIERNSTDFDQFLNEVLGILENEDPPAPGPDCQWCKWLDPEQP